MAFCPKCNETFETESGFCPYDGTTLQTGAPTPQSGIVAVSAAEGGLEALRKMMREDPKAEYDKLVGTTLDGRYRIEKKLGEGGMGVVFLGRHTIIEKPVAIKVLKKEVARDHSVVKRFVQEAKAASRIGHPNIVDVTDFGTTPDGLTYSVMEFVEGETLSAVIKREAPLPLARALPIVAQIAKALGAAHDKGIVHRDLKPENAFVYNRDGRKDFVKIVDFGIAKVMPREGRSADGPRLTRAGSVFGTPEYMAPEQAAGRPDTDRRVDVYALGTILYEMLVGKVPHKGDTTVRTLAMQMLEPIPPPRKANPRLDISDDLERVVMTALAKKRDERYATMADFMRDLEQVAGGVPLSQPLSASTKKVAAADERTLIPLPPGADALPTAPGATPQPRTMLAEEGPDTLKDPLTAAAEAKRPSRKPSKGDPAFVAGSNAFFELDESDYETPASSRWPMIVILLLVLGGGAAAAFFALRGGDGDKEVVVPAFDAGAIASGATDAGAPADATVVAELTVDAAVTGPTGPNNPDNGHIKRPRKPDAGPTIDPRVTHEIQVVTKPNRATLYVGTTYAGTGDTHITRPKGTKLTVKCTLPGYQPGSVDVSFDGVTEVYLCTMKRIKKCIPDLKNPFDDCKDE